MFVKTCSILLALCAGAFSSAAETASQPFADKPTLWLIGDSTVKVGTEGQKGWGEVLDRFLDLDKIDLKNHAIGGRSSRTFITEGRWDRVREELRPGDFVIMQFGHNDGGNINDDHRARGTIRGIGDETEAIDNMITGKHEIVYSYGHYMRRYVTETLAAGATPVVASLIPRKIWKDGKIERGHHSYAGWAKAIAEETDAHFIDLHEIIARRYEEIGPEAVEPFFADPHTHTTEEGAIFNAAAVIAGLKGLDGKPFDAFLSPKAEKAGIYPPED